MVCDALETEFEFHMIEYGFVAPDEPTFVPSISNCTPAMPEPESESDAVSVTDVPDTVAPAEGLVSKTAGAIVSTSMLLLADKFVTGVKLVMLLPSVEVAAPVTDETFKGLALSLPPAVYVQEAVVEFEIASVEHEPPELRLTVSPPVELMAFEKVRSISIDAPCLYAPFDTFEVMFEMMGTVVFHGGTVTPVPFVAKRFPKASAIVPFPPATYVTTTPLAPAAVILETVSTTFVVSEPGTIDETENVVPVPAFVTVNPPLFDFVIVPALASLLKMTVNCVSELYVAETSVGATLSTITATVEVA